MDVVDYIWERRHKIVYDSPYTVYRISDYRWLFQRSVVFQRAFRGCLSQVNHPDTILSLGKGG